MPLDPFFEERLRVHRRYLISKAVGAVRRRLALLWPFEREHPAADAMTTDAAPRASTRARDSSDTRRLAATDPARARARHRRAAVAWDRKELESVGTAGPDVATEEHDLTPDGLPAFRVRIYRPRLSGDAEAGEPTPAVVAFFGGAFRIGGIDYPTTDAAYRRRALDAGVAIVAVDYALAPEHRYPTPVEQGHAALEWVFAQADELGLDAGRIGVAGTSAGAGIAAAVTLMNRDRGGHPFRLQLLEVPVVDLTGRHLDLRATRALGIPSLIALRELRSVVRTYLPLPALAREPYASPLLAASHEGLPPAVILTAEYDPLRGDGDAYGDALRRAGVDASVVRYQGVTHDTAMFTGALPAARRWHADVITALRRLHD
ncbi:alpha/beta hydrolase [Microbacterium sp. HJ5]